MLKKIHNEQTEKRRANGENTPRERDLKLSQHTRAKVSSILTSLYPSVF